MTVFLKLDQRFLLSKFTPRLLICTCNVPLFSQHIIFVPTKSNMLITLQSKDWTLFSKEIIYSFLCFISAVLLPGTCNR